MFNKKIFFALLQFTSLAAFGVVPPYLQEKESYSAALNSYTLVAITFHYTESRFCYLEEVLERLSTFPKADIVIFTNTCVPEKIARIEQSSKKVFPSGIKEGSVSIKSIPSLKDPFDLTWSHKELIQNDFLEEKKGYSHFLYLEDDIGLDFTNFCYFLHFREVLRPTGLLPAFLRVEINQKGDLVATDNCDVLDFSKRKRLSYENLIFINPTSPHMGCFILDKELAKEYVQTDSFQKEKSKNVCPWEVRERAAMGLCFENIPYPFGGRYVVPITQDGIGKYQNRFVCPEFSIVYHLPNTYANDPESKYGKMPIESLFTCL